MKTVIHNGIGKIIINERYHSSPMWILYMNPFPRLRSLLLTVRIRSDSKAHTVFLSGDWTGFAEIEASLLHRRWPLRRTLARAYSINIFPRINIHWFYLPSTSSSQRESKSWISIHWDSNAYNSQPLRWQYLAPHYWYSSREKTHLHVNTISTY